MVRATNRLSARAVATAGPGYHADGGGLYLLVAKGGAASWVFRFTRSGRKREMGLGSATVFSLADARVRAAQQRRVLAEGLDPIEARRGAQAVVPRTWGEAAADFIANRKAEWRNEAQADQWRQSLNDHGPAKDLPVDRVDTDAVLSCLQTLWKPGGRVETATRLRGRIERIWDAERVRGNVSGENPARWRGHLEHLLPKPGKIATKRHHAAMPFAEVPEFMARLAERDGLARSALRFTILTAARTDETIGAPWSEFDLEAKLWTIPAERMKAGREHVVPLVDEAVAVLRARQGAQAPFAMSSAGMLSLLRKKPPKGLGLPYTVHGFRSGFRDWASETTGFPSEVVEMALAHTIKDKTEAAYRRGNLLAKRRKLMEAWVAYLSAEVATVTDLAAAREARSA